MLFVLYPAGRIPRLTKVHPEHGLDCPDVDIAKEKNVSAATGDKLGVPTLSH